MAPRPYTHSLAETHATTDVPLESSIRKLILAADVGFDMLLKECGEVCKRAENTIEQRIDRLDR